MAAPTRFGAAFLSLAVALQGCIHTTAREKSEVSVESEADGKLTRRKVGPLTVENLVYTPTKLPLEEFFTRLAGGEFTEAFKRIDLAYKPATTDNEAIEKLLDEGFVPVYVRITNGGKRPVAVAEESLTLVGDGAVVKAITADDLPKQFEHFNLAAVGANISNTVVVVAAVVGIVVIMALAQPHSSGFGNSGTSHVADGASDGGGNNSVYNSTTKTTEIAYRDYLLPAGVVAPGATIKGLVFFHAPDGADTHKLKLKLAPLK